MDLPFKGKSHAQLSIYKAGSSSWAGAIQTMVTMCIHRFIQTGKAILTPTTCMETLFWMVPLTIYLALTEKHEKAERMRIMWNTGCTEVEIPIILSTAIS
ncbi:Uncharacterised protein [Citrobacter amalonaticus]|uniref:Uncharacterized protein n=1 Tax=Citrobacter amalonaticus TaxID=35703 RepID=A0A6N2WZJ0_CITAM